MTLQCADVPLAGAAKPRQKVGGPWYRRLWCLVLHRRYRRYIEDPGNPEMWGAECRKCGWDTGPLR
jgi:hypothetical protein